MKEFLKILVLVALVAGMNSCYYDNPPEPVPFDCVDVSYSAHVAPIWAKSCATTGCHDPGNHEPDLSAENAYNVLLGDGWVNFTFPEESEIYKSLNEGMPPNGPLSPLDKQLVLCWIEAGARNN